MTSLGPDWRHDKLCRCYGVPDLLPVPSPSSCGWVLTAKGSADTVWVITLRFARGSFPFGPGFVACWCSLQLERCSTSQYDTTLHHKHWESRCYRSHAHTNHSTLFQIYEYWHNEKGKTVWPEVYIKIRNK